MDILGNVKKIPGGLMLVPMVITAVINTFFPQILDIGTATTALFKTGTMAIIGMILFVSGSQIKFNNLSRTIQRGGTLLLTRILISFAVGLIVMKTCGLDGFWGVSGLSLIITMTSCNPGLYLALTDSYGDNIDKGAMSMINLLAVPTFAVFVLSLSICVSVGTGIAGIPWMLFVSTMVPFFIGVLLTSIDEKIQGLFSSGLAILLVFLGFCLGSSVNLITAFRAGFQGVLLAVIFLAGSLPVMLLVDRFFLKRPGYAAAAFTCVGGMAIAVPAVFISTPEIMAAFGQLDLANYQDTAVAQITLAYLICTVCSPILTKMVVKHFGSYIPSDAK